MLVIIIALLVFGVDAVTRTPCTQTARFQDPQKGYSLDGNVLATLTVNNAANCVIKCLQHAECQSINFHVSVNPEHVCELNSKTDNDVTLTAKSDVIYYGPTQSNQPNCALDGPGECQNGGQCAMSCSCDKTLMCHCANGRTGLTCQDKTVANFGQDFTMVFPTRSVDNYISMENSNVQEISNITALFWINTLETTETMALLNYFVTTEGKMGEFRILLEPGKLDVSVLSDASSKLTFPFPPINDGYWHHVGITWSLGKYAVYLDGTLIYSGDSLGSAAALKARGEFIIGQLPDSSGNFDPSKSFKGKLTQLNVWNDVLSGDEIRSASKSCYNDVGTILKWNTVLDERHGAVHTESSTSCTALRRNKNYDVAMSATPSTSTQETHVVSTENIPSLQAFTISMWVKHSEYIRYVENTNNGGTSLGFRLHKDVLILEIAGANTKQARVPRYWKESPAYWHHISTTWSSNTAHWKIYLDGSLVSIMHDVASGITIPAGGQLLLGLGNPDNGDLSMDGGLSRLNIWDYELHGEVLSLMATKGPLFENGNVFAWYGVKSKAVGDMTFQETPSDMLNSREIADYQMSFTEASESNFARLHGVFPNIDITTFSACFWFKFSKYRSGVFSYSTQQYNSDLQVYLLSSGILDFYVRSTRSGVAPTINTGRWHFYCTQWRSSDGLVKIYKDGVEISDTTLKAGEIIPGNGAMVIGQEPDGYARGFDAEQAIKGELAGLNFWTDFLTANEVSGMAAGVINVNGNLLQWRDFRGHIYGDVTIKENSDCDLPEYRLQKLRDEYCENRYPGTYARFIRNKDVSFLWRCVRPSAMLDENMVYDIIGNSPSFFSRTAELLAIT